MKIIALTPGLLAGLLLTSCSFLDPIQTPNIQYYQLSVGNSGGNKPENTSDSTLYIAPFNADTPYDTRYLYISGNHQLIQQYNYYQWIAPPATMLTNLIISKTITAGIFQHVISGNIIGFANYKLNGQLIRLSQITDQGKSAEIVLEMRLTLSDNTSGRIIDTTTLSLKKPAGNNIDEDMDITNTLANQLADKVVLWLSDRLNRQPLKALKSPQKISPS
ncbi:MAG: ABC-type transport auxiliary lipoprotein family protein [Francisellaceae bacterium]